MMRPLSQVLRYLVVCSGGRRRACETCDVYHDVDCWDIATACRFRDSIRKIYAEEEGEHSDRQQSGQDCKFCRQWVRPLEYPWKPMLAISLIYN